MKNVIALSIAVSALLAPMLASAATTTELKLIGTITPAACAPNFTGGSTIDYGNIPAGTLNVTEQTILPEMNTTFTVTCDSAVKFALQFTDERAASLADGIVLKATDGFQRGLGVATGGEKIGAYQLQISNQTSDEGAAGRIISSDGGATWKKSGGGWASDSNLVAFSADDSTLVPAPHKSITMDVKVDAAIAPSNTLPVTDEIKIDGLTTVDVVYL